jgi:hypothetical protein
MDEKTFDALARGVGQEMNVPRRSVLSGVGAGLALALSALLSTRTGNDAEAGSFGGKLGGRHGKSHRGRDKNRHHHHHRHKRKKRGNKGNPPGLGGSGWIYVRMVVENLTNADIDFEGLALYEEMQGKICRTKALQTIHPNEAVTFAPGDSDDGYPTSFISALLNGQYGVDAVQEQGRNHEFPVVWAYSGIVDTNVEGCKTGTNVVISNRKMGVGQKLSFTLEGQKFELLRENDIDNARLFRLKVLA